MWSGLRNRTHRYDIASAERGHGCRRAGTGAALFALALSLALPSAARADVVLDWNEIAATRTNAPLFNPFAQARVLAITQLAVFEAVNAVNGDYEPYLGTIAASPGASVDAAVVAAAHAVLVNYISALPTVPLGAARDAALTALHAARAASLAAIPDGSAKDAGVALGLAAAAAMIQSRLNDGSAPNTFYLPGSSRAGEWQLTAACTAAGGIFYHWGAVTPFGIASADDFILEAPPALTSNRYAKDYVEVKTYGSVTTRPQDPTDVASFYASASPGHLLNSAARQLSTARGDSLSKNAWALALLNMAMNDALVASFANKYRYNFWRPETAIPLGESDGNGKTEGGVFVPYIATPCFPGYPSNHASGSGAGLEVLRRIYGAAGHALELTNPVSGVIRRYGELKQIANCVDDARVFGGIHFRFDQEAGGRLGREIATYIVKHNLRKTNPAQ